jgi:hypothetical protein
VSRPTAIAAVVVAAAAAVGATSMAVAAGDSPSGGSPTAPTVLEDAQRRAGDVAYRGVALVQWIDGSGVHKSLVSVRSSGHDTETIGEGRRVVQHGATRLVWSGGSWTSLGPAGPAAAAPPVAAKYDLRTATGPLIAGRHTVLVEAFGPGEVLEHRVALDRRTGVVLGRDWLDGGVVVRTFRFVVFDRAPAGTVPVTAPVNVAPTAAGPRVVSALPEPYTEPEQAGRGFRLVRRVAHSGGLVQLEYADGLSSVSVFQQPGRLRWSRLPAGGADLALDGVRARAYRVPLGTALVWERNGIVYTAVGDASDAEMRALAADVDDHHRSTLRRITGALLRPLRF